MELTKNIINRINSLVEEQINIPNNIDFSCNKIMGLRDPLIKMSKSSDRD